MVCAHLVCSYNINIKQLWVIPYQLTKKKIVTPQIFTKFCVKRTLNKRNCEFQKFTSVSKTVTMIETNTIHIVSGRDAVY